MGNPRNLVDPRCNLLKLASSLMSCIQASSISSVSKHSTDSEEAIDDSLSTTIQQEKSLN